MRSSWLLLCILVIPLSVAMSTSRNDAANDELISIRPYSVLVGVPACTAASLDIQQIGIDSSESEITYWVQLRGTPSTPIECASPATEELPHARRWRLVAIFNSATHGVAVTWSQTGEEAAAFLASVNGQNGTCATAEAKAAIGGARASFTIPIRGTFECQRGVDAYEFHGASWVPYARADSQGAVALADDPPLAPVTRGFMAPYANYSGFDEARSPVGERLQS